MVIVNMENLKYTFYFITVYGVGDAALSMSAPVHLCVVCLSVTGPKSSLWMRGPLNPILASWAFTSM